MQLSSKGKEFRIFGGDLAAQDWCQVENLIWKTNEGILSNMGNPGACWCNTLQNNMDCDTTCHEKCHAYCIMAYRGARYDGLRIQRIINEGDPGRRAFRDRASEYHEKAWAYFHLNKVIASAKTQHPHLQEEKGEYLLSGDVVKVYWRHTQAIGYKWFEWLPSDTRFAWI